MRIVYLHQYFTTPDRGGGTRSYEFARRWAAAGHDVHVLRISASADGPRQRWQVDMVDGISVHTLGLRYSNNMSFYRRLGAFAGFALGALRRIRAIDPDVVYATSTPLTVAIPALGAWRSAGTPYVFEVRDLWPDVPIAMGYLKNPLLRASAIRLERAAYENARHIIALAPGMKLDIVGKGIPAEKVTVIPQGCDVGVFRGADPAALRRDNQWLGDGPVFVYAGAIGQVNGLRYLLDLASAADSLDPTARFVVLGDGKERAGLVDLAERRGLLGRTVFFLGFQDKHRVSEWMAVSCATLALLAGPRALWKDAVQNKFFDSLAAERPIATNKDGWQTQIAEAEGVGIMLSPDDPALAARQLIEMVRDDEFMAAVPENCRRLAATRFNRDRQAEQALQIVLQAAGVDTASVPAEPRLGRGGPHE